MSDNMRVWNKLSKSDPAHTKGFKRAGGFSGTAIKPIWAIKMLTEIFGPVGIGWGHGKPDFTLVPADGGEILVYCTVECWHTSRENSFYGVGGDKAVAKNKNGLFTDDEAFKKAFTDATMNAFKSAGVAADIHMGLFDDDKYVAHVGREFNAPETISEDQRSELMQLLDQLNVPVAELLTIGKIKDLRDLEASRFDRSKSWINTRALEIRKQQENNA